MTRGRPIVSVLDRLVSKISIYTRPDLTIDDEEARSYPWVWTGAHRGLYGLIKLDGRMQQVHRVLFEILIHPLTEFESLRSENAQDVNPWHWQVYPPRPRPEDFLIDNDNVIDPQSDDEIEEICNELELATAKWSISSIYDERVAPLFEGLPIETIKLILKRTKLERIISCEPPISHGSDS